MSILYASYARDLSTGISDIEDDDDAVECWKTLWDKGGFDTGIVDGYLLKYEDRFNLFDNKRPFYQANIEAGSEYSAAKLNGSLFESGNKTRILTTVDGDSKYTMCYSDAARWLVHLIAFDDNSAKPSNFGKKDALKMPSASAGWLGRMGLVYAEGNNLFETLMMNFVLIDAEGEPFDDGKAPWELDIPNSAERVEIACPSSQLEILTMQSRRVLLMRENGTVTGYRLLAGDLVSNEGATTEQMTMWRANGNVWKPRRHDPSRMFWRDYQSLMAKVDEKGTTFMRPGICTWLSILKNHRVLKNEKLNFRTAGLYYGSSDYFVKDIVDDGLTFDSELLADMNMSWNVRIGELIVMIEDCIRALGALATNLAISCGCDRDVASKSDAPKARSIGYQALDVPFRQWMVSIDPCNDDIDDKIADGERIIRDTIMREGKELFFDSTNRTYTGNGKEGKDRMNGFQAFDKFVFAINKIFRKEVVNE